LVGRKSLLEAYENGFADEFEDDDDDEFEDDDDDAIEEDHAPHGGNSSRKGTSSELPRQTVDQTCLTEQCPTAATISDRDRVLTKGGEDGDVINEKDIRYMKMLAKRVRLLCRSDQRILASAESDSLSLLRGRTHHQAAQLRKNYSRGEEDEDAGTVQAERDATVDDDDDDGSDIDGDDEDAGLEEELTASSPIDNVDEYIFFADAFLSTVPPAVTFGYERDA